MTATICPVWSDTKLGESCTVGAVVYVDRVLEGAQA
jgi:hypothetical protein